MSASNPCTRLADDDALVQILEGTAAEELLDHVASCDVCRDARHDAESVRAHVADAGADWSPPKDLAARVLARIDARSASVGDASPNTLRTSDAALQTGAFGERTSAPLPAPGAVTGAPASVARTNEASANAPPTPAPKPTTPPARRGMKLGVFALAASFSVAASVGLALYVTRKPASVAAAGWHGVVAQVARAGKDGQGGLELCSAAAHPECHPATPGEAVPAGARLKTDARTRAQIDLADGTKLVLDRETEVALVSGHRSATVVRGIVAADVAHLEAGPRASIELPHATVDVIGTRFTTTATEDMSLVEVERGEVAFVPRTDASAAAGVDKAQTEPLPVRAGFEGRIVAGKAATVTRSAPNAEGGDWSELAPRHEDEPMRGIGELRAKKPGETKEREGAVRLAKHHVKVRISGNMARTEIDETFANQTAEQLEGIYRMPLPPDAQIERLALEVDGKLVEGAFVARDRAKAIWKGVIQNATPIEKKKFEPDIVWVPGPWRDPALLEWQRGGRFELRIFPIPAKGARRVVLSYTQTIGRSGAARRYTYPLAYDPSGSTTIEDFAIDAQVLGHDPSFGLKTRGYAVTKPGADDTRAERALVQAHAFVPAGDFALEYKLPNDDAELTAWTYARKGDANAKADATDRTAETPASAPSSAPTSTNAKAAASGKGAQAIDPAKAIEARLAADPRGFVGFAIRPKLPAYGESRERLFVIAVDASRSMIGERWRRATSVVAAMANDFDRRDRFLVVTCDTECRPLAEASELGKSIPSVASGVLSPGASAADDVRRALGAVEPQGAHDPSLALRSAIERGHAAAGNRKLHVLYVGDGAASAGTTKSDRIAKLAEDAAHKGEAVVTTIGIGTDADPTILGALARAGGGAFVRDSGQSVSSLVASVSAATRGTLLERPVLKLPNGLAQVVPETLDTLVAGGEMVVFARVEPGAEAVRGNVELDGEVAGEKFHQSFPVDVAMASGAGNAFVPRMYASLRIADLERTRGDAAKDEIVALSKTSAVASKYTSMLVLESEAMFKAFNVERSAAGDIWTGEEATETSTADGTTKFAEGSTLGSGTGRGYGGGHVALPPAATAAPMTPPPAKMGPSTAQKGAARPVDEMNPWDGRSQASAADPSGGFISRLDGEEAPKRRPRPSMPFPRDRGEFVPMRRVWVRKTTFATAVAPPARDTAAAEADLAREPDNRTKMRTLVRAYAGAGRLDAAETRLKEWLGRDPLDVDALALRADLAARTGDREGGLRLLGSVVDVRPDDAKMQIRLAHALEGLGESARACSHRIFVAESNPKDADNLVRAVTCARATGLGLVADELVASLSADGRRRFDAGIKESPIAGEVQIDATWDSDADVDVSLVDAGGQRFSWLGALAGTTTSRDGAFPRHEALGFASLPAGTYTVEVTSVPRKDGTRLPARGTLDVKAQGASTKAPFTANERTVVGVVTVSFVQELRPIEGW